MRCYLFARVRKTSVRKEPRAPGAPGLAPGGGGGTMILGQEDEKLPSVGAGWARTQRKHRFLRTWMTVRAQAQWGGAAATTMGLPWSEQMGRQELPPHCSVSAVQAGSQSAAPAPSHPCLSAVWPGRATGPVPKLCGNRQRSFCGDRFQASCHASLVSDLHFGQQSL